MLQIANILVVVQMGVPARQAEVDRPQAMRVHNGEDKHARLFRTN